MEQSTTSGEVAPNVPSALGANNSFRTTSQPQDAEKEVMMDIKQPLEPEKQVLEVKTGTESINSSIPAESEFSPQSPTMPEREAGKEVLSSWQSKSQEESGAIPMAYHESQPSPGGFMNDIKGPPPSYSSLAPSNRAENDDLTSTSSSVEPDGASPLPPRPEDRSAVGQMLSWIPPAPKISPAQMRALIQPVIIPQLEVPPEGESVPFSRCYSDVLASHDVSAREFAAFLDGLALAQAPNSTLQGLRMFGVGVSSVHLPFIPMAGRGIKALASTGSGHSSSRARLYIERARKEYFEPRGLHLTVLKDKDLNARLQIPSHAYRLAPLTKNTLTSSLRERRLEGVAPYVAPLRYDLPEPESQIKGVQKLARKHLEQRFTSDAKRLSKLREKQWKDITFSNGQYGSWDDRYAAKMSELRRIQTDLMRYQSLPDQGAVMREILDALWKTQRELQVLVSEREMALQSLSQRTEGVEAEMKEDSWSRGLKWIVIENLQ